MLPNRNNAIDAIDAIDIASIIPSASIQPVAIQPPFKVKFCSCSVINNEFIRSLYVYLDYIVY